MRGRPPQPTVLHILRGTFRKDRANKREPLPDPAAKGSLKCPAWMPIDGKREWKRIVPELYQLGLVTKLDLGALEGYCLAYARALEAGRLVKTSGMTIVTDKGFTIQHPAISIERASWALAKMFAAEFGFTPSSRTRIPTQGKPKGGDADAGFIFGAAKNGKRP